MGNMFTRVGVISTYLIDRIRHGRPDRTGRMDREVVFVVDGVGGFQAVPVMLRKAWRDEPEAPGTILHRWQYGLPGEIWTDLMWLRRNRVMGAKLAQRLLRFRRAHRGTTIHVLAYSGGAGIAVFACECLRGRPIVETLVLPCPALSSEYNMAPALSAVARCYALVSHLDRGILGLGTRLFGTTDRRFEPAAGMVGFRIPTSLPDVEAAGYERMREIRWSPALREYGHSGGHMGWACVRMLRRHLLPIIRGKPLLPVHRVARACQQGRASGSSCSKRGE